VDAPAPVHLQIIATTESGTRAALAVARRILKRMDGARPLLLVPRKSSPSPRLDARAVDDYRRLAAESGVEVTVRLCLCSGYAELSKWMVARDSITVIGGTRRWWWPTRAERVAAALKRVGCETLFADASRSGSA
jgi:hypothetical protein